jgi:hypothetical protein
VTNLLAEYTFADSLLTVVEIFVFMAWLLVLFTILNDLWRDHELAGWQKGLWVLFLIFIPFLTALVYLVTRHKGMRERTIEASVAVRNASPAEEIDKLAKLKEAGTISQAEFDHLKARIMGPAAPAA